MNEDLNKFIDFLESLYIRIGKLEEKVETLKKQNNSSDLFEKIKKEWNKKGIY